MKKLLCLLVFMVLVTLAAAAQTEYPTVEVAGGYSYVNLNPQIASSQNFNGGGGAFVYNFSSIFGVKADLMGYTGGSGWNNYLREKGYGSVNVSANAFTYMFGPQIKKHSGKFQPFGEGLFGAAHSNGYGTLIGCIENQGCGTRNAYGNNNAFAMEFGGGVDIALSDHIQIRPVEVDYMLTRFGYKSYSASQNNFKYFGGVNFTLGGK